jgi:ParB/RepB/Spo0J family partition protein
MSNSNALALDGESPTLAEGVRVLSVGEIVAPEGFNARKDYGDQSGTFEQLCASIKERGVLQPILVRPSDLGGFEVVAGFRRLAAANAAGLDSVPCLVRNSTSGEARLDNLVENLLRDDLNCVEEAEGMAATLVGPPAMEQEVLAGKIGRSQSYISHSLPLLALPSISLALLRERALTRSHGMELARLAKAGFGASEIDQVATHAHSESLSVAALSARIAGKIEAKAKADSTPPLFQEPEKPAPAPAPDADDSRSERHAAPHTAPASAPATSETNGLTPEQAKKEFEESGGATSKASDLPALDAAREKAAEAKPAGEKEAVTAPASTGSRIAASITPEDDDWLFEENLSLDQALVLARRARAFLDVRSVKLVKALTDDHTAKNPGRETPISPSDRLFSILAHRAEQSGLDVDTILENPE